MPPAWVVEERIERPTDLHASWPGAEADPLARRIAVCRPTRPAVVLGSTQHPSAVDAAAAAAAGLDVVRRRSGGGAVLVTPEDPVWVDAWVPASDPLWRADVTGAFGWFGAAWAATLVTLGLTEVEVQGDRTGACTRWSSLVCFGGVGAGEVTAGGRKVVGVAQRRNRSGAWFHGACVLAWDPTLLLEVLELSPGERATAAAGLSDAVVGVRDALGTGARPASLRSDVTSALLDSLP